ncbi:MAG TPA: hypothetical protein VKV73_04510 [Chloroflexota bacterium]|nr:hypothetical protein [Chloroflexota bacterium]
MTSIGLEALALPTHTVSTLPGEPAAIHGSTLLFNPELTAAGVLQIWGQF